MPWWQEARDAESHDSQAVLSQSFNQLALDLSRDSANERIGTHARLVARNRFRHRTDTSQLLRLPECLKSASNCYPGTPEQAPHFKTAPVVGFQVFRNISEPPTHRVSTHLTQGRICSYGFSDMLCSHRQSSKLLNIEHRCSQFLSFPYSDIPLG